MYYYRSAAAAWAIAEYETRKNAEHGTGYALIDEKGAFFCGFRQPDGELAFDRYRQTPQGHTMDNTRHYNKDEPVFMSPEQMEHSHLAAAVFGTEFAANAYHELPPALQKIVRRVSLSKDIDYLKPAPSPDLPVPQSQPGLASPASCRSGKIDGYVNIRTALSQGVRQLWDAFRI